MHEQWLYSNTEQEYYSQKKSELEDMDRKSRKTMIMDEASHLKSGMDKLCVMTKVGGGGLMSVECRNEEEENSLGFAHSEVNLIRGVDSAKTINSEDMICVESLEKLKNRKHKNLNKTGVKRKCMDS